MSQETPPKELNKLTVAELKEELSSRGLPVSGVKKELLERIMEDDKCNDTENHVGDIIDEEIIQANSAADAEKNGEEPEHEAMEAEEHHEEHHDEHREGGAEQREDIHSDDELDDVLGDSAREAFEEMRDDDYDEDQEYVTLDKVDDKDGEEGSGTGEKDEEGKDKPTPEDDEPAEQLPVPPEQLHKWFLKQSSTAKKYSSVYVSELTAKDVLCPAMVEWSNRACVFCINYDREGKGASMMNFSSDAECKEAKEALNTALGEGVKVMHPSSSIETDIKDALCFRFDGISALSQRWLMIEDAPPNTTEDQINSLFPEGLLAVRPDMKTQAYNWQSKEYILPEKVSKVFLVEFATPKKASSAIAEDKTYELDGVKLKVELLADFEDVYKKEYIKILSEKREERWEELEKKKKEELKDVKMSNEERLQAYRDLENTVQQRAKLTRNPTVSWEEKMLEKQKFTMKVYDIVRKIDADTNRRVKDEEKFPEHSRIMTRHTKTEFLRLPPHIRGTYEGKYEDIPFSKSGRYISTRGGRGESRYESSYRGRGRGGYSSSYRGRGDGYRGRGDSSYRGSRGGSSSYYESRDTGYHSKDTAYSVYEPKRRRTEEYDSYGRLSSRKEDPSVVTHALKSLTEVLSTKMDEMSRIAGGMKARERELEDAVHTLKRKDRSPPSRSTYPEDSYSSRSRGGGGGASRGSYSQGYSSYSSRGGSSTPSQSRYRESDHREPYSSTSSRYHDRSEDSYTADRHYSSRGRPSSGAGGGYTSERRSSTGYSSRRGGSSSYH